MQVFPVSLVRRMGSLPLIFLCLKSHACLVFSGIKSTASTQEPLLCLGDIINHGSTSLPNRLATAPGLTLLLLAFL
ncbi:uncharacterized protein BDW70DRAFT_134444 [Aspergillus foveolatus]|uniref:uncharacterized protein n=1 Tax=Aspergillus foveolatus TaxID=210207 RepID=UPI003CCD500B